MYVQFPRGWEWNRTLLDLQSVVMLCGDSTGCDEVDDYFATEADTMVDIVCEVDLS